MGGDCKKRVVCLRKASRKQPQTAKKPLCQGLVCVGNQKKVTKLQKVTRKTLTDKESNFLTVVTAFLRYI